MASLAHAGVNQQCQTQQQASQEIQSHQMGQLPLRRRPEQIMNSSPMASLPHAGVNRQCQILHQASQEMKSHQIVHLPLQQRPEQNMNSSPMANLAHVAVSQQCQTQQQASQEIQSHQMVGLPLQRRPEQIMNSNPIASLPQAGVGPLASNLCSVQSADERMREYLRKHNWPEYMVPGSSVEKFKITEAGFNEEGDLTEIELNRAYNRNIDAYNVTWAKQLRAKRIGDDMILEAGITAGSARFLKGVQLPVTMIKKRKQQLIFVVKPPLFPSVAVALPCSLFELEAENRHVRCGA